MVEPVKFGVNGPENRVTKIKLGEVYPYIGGVGVADWQFDRVPFLRDAMLAASYDNDGQIIDLSEEYDTNNNVEAPVTPTPRPTSIPAGQGLMAGSLSFTRSSGNISSMQVTVAKHSGGVLSFSMAFPPPPLQYGSASVMPEVAGAYLVVGQGGLWLAVRTDIPIHPPILDLLNTVLDPSVVVDIQANVKYQVGDPGGGLNGDGSGTIDIISPRGLAMIQGARVAITNQVNGGINIEQFRYLPAHTFNSVVEGPMWLYTGQYKAFNLAMLLSVPPTTSLRF